MKKKQAVMNKKDVGGGKSRRQPERMDGAIRPAEVPLAEDDVVFLDSPPWEDMARRSEGGRKARCEVLAKIAYESRNLSSRIYVDLIDFAEIQAEAPNGMAVLQNKIKLDQAVLEAIRLIREELRP